MANVAAKSSKTKWLAGGAVVLIGGAAAAVGIVYGLKANEGGGSGGNLKGSNAGGQVTDPATVAKCGPLQVYGTVASGKLDGALSTFAYGPEDAACCASEYSCPFASVSTYACADGSTTYELLCCPSDPGTTGSAKCGADTYQANVGAAAKAGRFLAVTGDCQPTGFTKVVQCSARPATKGLTTTYVKGELAAAPAPTPVTPPVTPRTPAPAVGTVAPTKVVKPIPVDEQCVQPIPPPGVKPNSCMILTCMPKGVKFGEKFHATVRWCIQRPRRWHLTFDMLDMKTKEYYQGAGFDDPDPIGHQCGEHTFESTFNIPQRADGAPLDIMWKYFIAPKWGIPGSTERTEPFPNMIGETGIDKQPSYGALIDDCPVVPDRFWNREPTGVQDSIEFIKLPTCITPGNAWSVEIVTHLESAAAADLHVNLQIGTGGDKYLGPDDIFVAETDWVPLTENTVAAPKKASTVTFTAAQTKALKPGALVYVAAFMTPAGAQFGDVPEGWDILEREFYLNASVCGGGAPAAAEVEVEPAAVADPARRR